MKRICLVAVVLAMSLGAVAQTPNRINYQGRLTDPNGRPKQGTADMAVRIFTNQTGGASVWVQVIGQVTLRDGVYNFAFGDDSLPVALDYPECWMELVVDGKALAPRQRLVAVPYAVRSSLSEYATMADRARVAETATQAEMAMSSHAVSNMVLSEILSRSNHTGRIGVTDLSDDLFNLLTRRTLVARISPVTTTRYEWTKVSEMAFRHVYGTNIHVTIDITVRNTSENQSTHGLLLSMRLNEQEFAGLRVYGNEPEDSFRTWNLDYDVSCRVSDAKVEIWASHDTGGSQGQVSGGIMIIGP